MQEGDHFTQLQRLSGVRNLLTKYHGNDKVFAIHNTVHTHNFTENGHSAHV